MSTEVHQATVTPRPSASIDGERFCRLCATPATSNCLQSFAAPTPASDNLLATIQRLNRGICRGDNMPQYVCTDCVQQLNQVEKFVQRIANAQKILTDVTLYQNVCTELKKELEDYSSLSIKNELKSTGDDYDERNLLSNDLQLIKHDVDKLVSSQIPDLIGCDDHDDNEDFNLEYSQVYNNGKDVIEEDNIEFESNNPKKIKIEVDLQDILKTNVSESLYFEATELLQNLSLCRICNKTFKNKYILKKHKENVHRPKCLFEHENKDFTCDICDKKFTLKKFLDRHKRINSDSRCDNAKISCKLCKKHFKNKYILNTHKLNVHGSQTMFICHFCGRCFKKKYSLVKHINIHTGMEQFSCTNCGKRFRKKKYLDIHLSSHSESGLALHLVCKLCNKTFKNQYTLSTHQTNVHDPQLKFICQLCGKGFKKKASLVNHIAIHTDINRFSCTYCGKLFRRKKYLDMHQSSHDEGSDFANTCKICNKVFKNKYILNTHDSNVHNPQLKFMCQICGKGFKKKSSLKDHINVHSGLKLFSCGVCDKKFAKKEYLDSHKSCHSTVKLHSCEVCTKSYKFMSGLRKHLKTPCVKESMN